MTRPDPWQDEQPDALEAALDRYARAFPKAGLPFLRGVAGPEAHRVAAELLDRAVARGRPLDHWAIMRGLGYRRPPEGACWWHAGRTSGGRRLGVIYLAVFMFRSVASLRRR